MQKLSEVLEDVKTKTLRFLKKLEECENQVKPSWQGAASKENAAVRRAALDLKNELTKITQSTTY